MPTPKKSKTKPTKRTAAKSVPSVMPEKTPPETPQETPPAPAPLPTVETPGSLPPPEPVSAAELVSPLTAGMPEPTNSPMGENPAGAEPPPVPGDPVPNATGHQPFGPSGIHVVPPPFQTGQVDGKGIVFDPAKHMADETGRPKFDANGNFYSKNIGRKKKSEQATETEQGNPPEPTFADIPGNDGPSAPASASTGIGDRFDLAAELYCRTGYGVAATAFSDDGWLPENKAEHEALKTAVAAYLRATNKEDLPPGVALAFALAAYAGKRVTRPKTADKLRAAWIWIRAKLGKRKMIAEPPEPEKDTKGDEP